MGAKPVDCPSDLDERDGPVFDATDGGLDDGDCCP